MFSLLSEIFNLKTFLRCILDSWTADFRNSI